jgi:hypothetical protein
VRCFVVVVVGIVDVKDLEREGPSVADVERMKLFER